MELGNLYSPSRRNYVLVADNPPEATQQSQKIHQNFTLAEQGFISEENDSSQKPAIKEKSRKIIKYSIYLLLASSILILCGNIFAVKFARLHQSTIMKVTPYKQTSHPDPPTSYWGTVQKPYPTGAFWTNLVVKNGDGAIGLYPYGIKTLDVGIQVSYGASRRQVSSAAITDTFGIDLQISATQGFVSRAVETYDNVSVTIGYKTANMGKYRGFFVKSSPYVTVYFDGATPVISSPLMKIIAVDARVVKDSTGTQYIVTLGNYQKWLVFCSEAVMLTWKENALTAAAPIRGFVRVAILPSQNVESAFTQLLNYVQRYPIGGTVTFSYPTSSTGCVNIQYNTVGAGPLLMLALPHHNGVLSSLLLNSPESKAVQAVLTPIWSIKGKMKAVVGDFWRLTYNFYPASWHYPLQDKLSINQLDEIAKHLLLEVKLPYTAAVDIYSFAKQLGKMARLALLADNLGISDARQQAIFNLETTIIPWLQGMNQDPLLYDKVYGGLVTAGSLTDPFSNFGSGWYSDHHFHFGYFINAIAVMVKLDLPFYEANKAGLDSIVRDICNPDITDPDFPFARHKDFFDGHSWASGLFQQANGKGQESSSEVKNIFPFLSH